MTVKKTIDLVVSSGQYEQCACVVTVKYTTDRGLKRRIKQLKDAHGLYGDNWVGWIRANIAIASKNDRWGDNSIIGGKYCIPANGWIEEEECY